MGKTVETKKPQKKKNKTKKLLTPQQVLFKNIYLSERVSATEAAIRAGYSKKTAANQACRLLRNVHIQDAILKEYQKAGFIVQKSLARSNAILDSDIRDFMTVVDGGAVEFIPFDKIRDGATASVKKLKDKRVIKENPDGSTTTYNDLEIELFDVQKEISNVYDMAGLKKTNLDITSGGESLEPITIVMQGKEK